MGCWCGYLSGARCRLCAYGPADAAAIPKPRHLLPHSNPDWFYLSSTGLSSQIVLGKRPVNGCNSGSSSGGGGAIRLRLYMCCIMNNEMMTLTPPLLLLLLLLVESTLDQHTCPLCGKLTADVRALMVRHKHSASL